MVAPIRDKLTSSFASWQLTRVHVLASQSQTDSAMESTGKCIRQVNWITNSFYMHKNVESSYAIPETSRHRPRCPIWKNRGASPFVITCLLVLKGKVNPSVYQSTSQQETTSDMFSMLRQFPYSQIPPKPDPISHLHPFTP